MRYADTEFSQFADGDIRLGAVAEQSFHSGGIARIDSHGYRFAVVPFMGVKVVGHTADGIGVIVEQILVSVIIEVNGPFEIAPWHELSHAHGSGI